MIKTIIVGTGNVSEAHIQGCLDFPERCEIVGMVNDLVDLGEKKAAKFGLDVPVYQNWDQALNGIDFDLALICTPPHVHAPATIDLLRAGKHVLLEKPMAPSLEECDAMLAAQKESGTLFSVVGQNRFKNPIMKTKQILSSGLLGRILHARIDSFWWRGSHYYDLWWRGTWAKEGGGCTVNHAIHHIDLFNWMMDGKPEKLLAIMANLNHENSEVEDFSTTVMWYPNGGIGQLTASLVHHGEDQRFTFQGENGMVGLPWHTTGSRQRQNGFPDVDEAFKNEVQALYDSLPDIPYEDHKGQIYNVLQAIEGEAELLIDGQQGRDTIEVVSAIYQSGITGQAANLPVAADSAFYTKAGILEQAPHFHQKTKSVREQGDEGITFGAKLDK